MLQQYTHRYAPNSCFCFGSFVCCMMSMLMCLLVCAIPFVGYAQSSNNPDGWYVVGEVGLGLPNSQERGTITADLAPGFAAAGAVGYHIRKMFRLEFEGLYMFNNFDTVDNSISDVSAKGDQSLMAGFANFYVDLGRYGDVFQPFVGIGAGYGLIDHDLQSSIATLEDDVDTGLYQLMGGFGLDLNPNIQLTTKIRYISTLSDPEFKALPSDFSTWLMTMGLKYNF